jgi:hypothetical protein
MEKIEGELELINDDSVVFVKTEGLDALVNGGDGSHSHVLERSHDSVSLIPSISQGKVIISFYFLISACITGGVYSLFYGDFFDFLILLAFALCFYLFIKKGKGFGEVHLEITSRKLRKKNKKDVFTVNLDDIEHLEIINKINSGGNGYFIQTSELNVLLKNGLRLNLATGGDMDAIISQATALAETIDCDVHHDDSAWAK